MTVLFIFAAVVLILTTRCVITLYRVERNLDKIIDLFHEN